MFTMILSCGSNQCMRQYLLVDIALIVISVSLVDSNLRLVSVIFRHGDRTPANNGYEMYPKDPYLNYTFYPIGQGQLTNVGRFVWFLFTHRDVVQNKGKERAYNLGMFLRKRYDNFLGKSYVPQIVKTLSSDYDRTKMSLQLVLAGLFSPDKKWNNSLNWQPIPTDYLRRNEDHLFLADMCPRYIKEYEKAVKSPEQKMRLKYYIDSMKELPLWTGKQFTHPLDFSYLYHTLHAESSLGLKLPDWANRIFPEGQLFDATVLGYQIANSSPLLRKLYGGPYIRTVTDIIKEYKTDTLKNLTKIYLYSGHETNIVATLSALNVYYRTVPEYTSAVIIELHEINHQYYIKILYYLGKPATIQELQMPGCEVLCPMDTFLESIANVIPSDKDLICKKT